MSNEKDAEYFDNYKLETIYINDHPVHGKYINLVTQEISPQVKLVLQAFYVDKKEDIKSFKLIKLNHGKEENSMVFSGMTFEKITEFMGALKNLDLKNSESARYKLITEYDLSQLKQIVENNPNIDDIYAIAKKREALLRFKELMDESSTSEPNWQEFFESNKWIFGHGLNYVFLDPVAHNLEQITTGSDFNKAGKRVDALMKTRAEISQYVLIEIKKSSTKLLEGSEYRSGCWPPSRELINGVTQIQKTCFEFLQNRFKDQLKDEEGNSLGVDVYAIQPKTYLIVGNLSEICGNDDKMISFELYRKSVNNPEIITFDELYERAKCIVENIDN